MKPVKGITPVFTSKPIIIIWDGKIVSRVAFNNSNGKAASTKFTEHQYYK